MQLLDEQGNVVTPITFDGSTYLPARAIASSLDVAVDYDEATKSVPFGEKVEGVPLNATQTFTKAIKDPNQTKYMGKDYQEVIKDTSNNGSNFSLKPEKKYQTLYLQVAALGTEVKVKIEDGNSRLLKQETVRVEDGLRTIEANVNGQERVVVFYKYKNKEGVNGIFVPLTTSYYK